MVRRARYDEYDVRRKQYSAVNRGISRNVFVQRHIPETRHSERKHAAEHRKQLIFQRSAVKQRGKFCVVVKIAEMKPSVRRISDRAVAKTTQHMPETGNKQQNFYHCQRHIDSPSFCSFGYVV